MGDLALIDDRHSLKAAMGMRADSTRRYSRGEDCWASKIKQQERANGSRLCAIAEQGPNRKSIANPMLVGIAANAEDLFFHFGFPFCKWPSLPCATRRSRTMRIS
jgi:hypothetical protein